VEGLCVRGNWEECVEGHLFYRSSLRVIGKMGEMEQEWQIKSIRFFVLVLLSHSKKLFSLFFFQSFDTKSSK